MTDVKILPFRNRKIFLGGTCPGSEKDFDYRKHLIPILENFDKLDFEYFNPVVEDWTPECIEIEENAKIKDDIHLYVISPNMKGVYSIAESFGSLIKNKNKRVILIIIKEIKEYDLKFEDFQKKSLAATGKLLSECGGEYYSFDSLYSFKECIINILIED
jgi:hypothetical protein